MLTKCQSSPGGVRHGSECELPFCITFRQHTILAVEPGACLGVTEALQGQSSALAESLTPYTRPVPTGLSRKRTLSSGLTG